MSFETLNVEYSDLLRQGANENMMKHFKRVIPTKEHISGLPLPKNLKIYPYYQPITPGRFLEEIIDFNVNSDDVFVSALPKSGSSWMEIIVWLLTHGLDYDKNRTITRKKLVGDFEDISIAKEMASELLANDPTQSLDESTALKMAWNASWNFEAPRVIKTHLPIYFLPKQIWSTGAKVIYLVRNPKDQIVSGFHYLQNYAYFDITMDDAVNAITNDLWVCGPHLDHILNFWNVRHLPNVHFVSYEDLVNEPFATIKQTSEFLGCSYTDEQLKELTEYISFDNMKNIKTINREDEIFVGENVVEKQRPDAGFKFLRKGKVGTYRDELNDDQIKKIDNWIENGLKDTDFRFKI